jgi:spermidine synthase
MARLLGARKIDALELNAGVLKVVENSHEFTDNVYGQEGVRAVQAEGRQFVRSAAKESYDLVVMALAQSLISNLAEYALSENYLYTSEAFCDYLRVLRPGGVLAVTLNKNNLLLRLEATARQ